MVTTLAFGLEVRDAQLRVVEHCALVSRISTLFGRLVGLSEADTYILDTAAQLHEIGMFAIPSDLLQRSAPLSDEELARVRAQARISAEVAASMHHPRVARVIEHQYDDHASLVDRIPDSDLLLIGLFRAADLIAAVTRPRPYQKPLPPAKRAEIFLSGAGTRFHPNAVTLALQYREPY